MGAASFAVEAQGDSPLEAFNAATEQARWEYGHGGYSGTIAEKCDFAFAQGKPPSMSAWDYVKFLENDGFNAVYGPYPGQAPTTITPAQRRDLMVYADKWGPALCIPIAPNHWLFAGLASS